MTAEEKIQVILTAAAGVTALVPAARIKPPGDWQGLALPYIVHQPVAGEVTRCHDGSKALRIWRYYQVSCFGATHSAARIVADAVVAALDGYNDSDVDNIAPVAPPRPLGYDTDLKVALVVIDFEIAGALT